MRLTTGYGTFNQISETCYSPATCYRGVSDFTAPQLVNRKEWEDHAEKWRKSIDE